MDIYCTICSYKFDECADRLERVCEHPVIPVPLCAKCFDEIKHLSDIIDKDDEVDECMWCAQGGTLVMCDSCNCSFCEDCIRQHCGSDALNAIIEATTWNCFSCDPTPLLKYQEILDQCSSSSQFPESKEETENLLWSIETKLKECHRMLDTDAISAMLTEKRNQCAEDLRTEEEFASDTEELKKLWKEYMVLLEYRVEELQEHLDEIGGCVDIFYQLWEKHENEKSPQEDTDKYSSVDETFLKSLWSRAVVPSGVKFPSHQKAISTSSSLTYCHDEDELEESHDDKAKLYRLNAIAATDDTLKGIISSYPFTLPTDIYPPSFKRQTPVDVLNALSIKDLSCRQMLEEMYEVPQEVRIVMRYLPLSLDLLTSDKRMDLHPAIAKALLLTENPSEVALLKRKFDIIDDIDAIHDFGSTSDIRRISENYKTQIFGENAPTRCDPPYSMEELLRGESEQLVSYADEEDRDEDRMIKRIVARRRTFGRKRKSESSAASEEDNMSAHIILKHKRRRELRYEKENGVANGLGMSKKLEGWGLSSSSSEPLPIAPPDACEQGAANEQKPTERDDTDEGLHMELHKDEDGKVNMYLQGRPQHSTGSFEDPIDLCDSDSSDTTLSVNFYPDSDAMSLIPPGTQRVSLSIKPAPPIYLHNFFSTKLMEHQKEAVSLMWRTTMSEIFSTGFIKYSNEKVKAECTEDITLSDPPDGSGCIIAHCMGSGKSLSTVAFTSTLLTDPLLRRIKKPSRSNTAPLIQRILILAPVNVVANWRLEYMKWMPYNIKDKVKVFLLTSSVSPKERYQLLKKWFMSTSSVLIVGKDLFCKLLDHAEKAQNTARTGDTEFSLAPNYAEEVLKYLNNPGPDVVVFDEAHHVKKVDSRLFKHLSNIRTRRRICLTGSPIQNNLRELFSMVEFVCPKYLRGWKKFESEFVTPIRNGGAKDASDEARKIMKRKSHVLNKKLQSIIARRNETVLTAYLKPKREYAIFIRLTPFQKYLYKISINTLMNGPLRQFEAFKRGMRVWDHPACLPFNLQHFKTGEIEAIKKLSTAVDYLRPVYAKFICSSVEKSSEKVSPTDAATTDMQLLEGIDNEYQLGNSSTLTSEWEEERAASMYDYENNLGEVDENMEDTGEGADDWWRSDTNESSDVNYSEHELLESGNKVIAFLSILSNCISIGDKVVLFSQSLVALDVLESILSLDWGATVDTINQSRSALRDGQSLCCHATCDGEMLARRFWSRGNQYMRLDGSVQSSKRQDIIKKFNESSHCQLFLISTMAGNMGINLPSANRVIIFDTCWNPVNDLQAIYRCYRYGQLKPTFIYRLVAANTMEERVYKMQITKLSVAARVVDAQMPKNHYTSKEVGAHISGYSSDTDEEFEYVDTASHDLTKEDRLNMNINHTVNVIQDDAVLKDVYNKLWKSIRTIDNLQHVLMDDEGEHLDERERLDAEKEFEEAENTTQLVAKAMTSTLPSAAAVSGTVVNHLSEEYDIIKDHIS